MRAPFVGARSYKTLLEWFYRMDVDVEMVRLTNAYDIEGKPYPAPLQLHGIKVVALGESAAAYCEQRAIPHFKLPHPSGLNRELNDQKALSETLMRCKRFIYKKTS